MVGRRHNMTRIVASTQALVASPHSIRKRPRVEMLMGVVFLRIRTQIAVANWNDEPRLLIPHEADHLLVRLVDDEKHAGISAPDVAARHRIG